MKKMKKVFATLLAATMVMSMGMTAYATEDGSTDSKVVITEDNWDQFVDQLKLVPKTYKANTGVAPAADFKFHFEYDSYKSHYEGTNTEVTVNDEDVPKIDDVTVSFTVPVDDSDTNIGDKDENNEIIENGKIEIEAKDYPELGIYTYKVTEVEPESKVAGVSYTGEELYLVLTILRKEDNSQHYVAALHYQDPEGDKSDGFKNTYNSGELNVTKEITGNMANMEETFEFTVTFSAADGTSIADSSLIKLVVADEEIEEGETPNYTVSDDGLRFTFELGDGETATFTNLPAGIEYTVTEEKEGYVLETVTFGEDGEESDEVTYDATDDTIIVGAEGTIAEATDDIGEGELADTDTVIFTNNLAEGVDTGIILDSAPYILLLALAGLGMFAVVNKKREDEI